MLNLARPDYLNRNVALITAQLVERYEQITQKRLYDAQPERLMIDLLAYCVYLLREQVQNAAEQNLVQYAVGIILEHHAQFYGILRLGALKSKTVLKFVAEPGTPTGARPIPITISAGMQVRTKDGRHTFQTLQSVEIPLNATEITVEAEALVATADANDYALGEVSEPLTTIAWIERIENTVVTHSGADAESDEQLRRRIIQAPESFSVAGPSGAYQFFALSAHPAIIDVSVSSPLPGIVEVAVLTTNGIPTPEIVSDVQEMLSDEIRRPLCDTVRVIAPVRRTYSINVAVTLYQSAPSVETRAVILERLEQYAQSKRVKLGRDIVLTHIIGIIQQVTGVYHVQVVSPSANVPVDFAEYADCTAITVTLNTPTNEELVTYSAS